MRKKSRQMLETIAAAHTKAALLAFWSDLGALDREQFEAAISPKPPKARASRPAKRQQSARTTDGPVDRIRQLVLVQCALEPREAALAIKTQLGHQKVAASRVPSYDGGEFSAWLTELFKAVPSSKVLHAAVALSSEAERGVR